MEDNHRTTDFVHRLDILDGTIAKMNELGPYRRAAVHKWIVATYGVCAQTARNYYRLAQNRLVSLTRKSAEQHTVRYLAKLDDIIYGDDTADRNRISAIDKACLLLGLYRQQVTTPQAYTMERLTAATTEEALEHDTYTFTPCTPSQPRPLPDHPSPVVVATLHPKAAPDAWPCERDSSTPGETW